MVREAIPREGILERFGRGFSQGFRSREQTIASQQLQNEETRLANALQRIKFTALTTDNNEAANAQLNQMFLDDPDFPEFAGGNKDFSTILDKFRVSPRTAQQAVGIAQRVPAGLGAEVPFGPEGKGRIKRPVTKPEVPTKGVFQEITDSITGEQINALVNPITGKIIRRFGTVEEGLSAKDKITVAVTQAKEFRADPRIKNLHVIERSERGMQAALKQATSPDVKSRIASDQALGVLFQKMLDPESVVRESEYARTPEGAAAMNRLLAIAPQLILGGLRLLDEDRQALVTMARKLLIEAKITANRAFDEFETRADEIGLNKKVVFGGAKKFQIAEQQTAPQAGMTATNPQTGEQIQSFDGGKTWQPIQ